jgi:hypothetical protein
VSSPLRVAPVFASVLVTVIAGCSSSSTASEDDETGEGGGGNSSSANCSAVTNVSDGPTKDETVPKGSPSIICYYPQPTEGYCRQISDPGSIDNYVGLGDKGAIGCKDGIIAARSECPTKNRAGVCDGTSIEAQRVYYKCSKFTDPKAHCAEIKGTFSP